MKRKQLLSSVVVFIGIMYSLSTATVWAKNSYLEQIDSDKDGYISIKEAVSDPNLLAVFGKIDSDGDGKISQKELEATDLLQH